MIGIGVGIIPFIAKIARAVSDYVIRVTSGGGVVEASDCANTQLTSLDSRNLYNNASFIIFPSGYKADVAYAELPANGNGDLTWARNSPANRTLANGTIQQVGANVPRLSYMYGSCPALLLEPQRTNSIRNSTMQGASTSPSTLPTNWGSVNNGITHTIVGVGTENGLPYVDVNFSGTATSTDTTLRFESVTQIVASSGQTWANTFYAKLISASSPPLSYNIGFYQRTSTGTFVTITIIPFTPTSTLTRINNVVTITDATVARVQPTFLASVTNGASYDFTIRIAAPQMELGAFATTWINTTNAAATRLTDSFTRNNIYTNGLISASGGTWYVELRNNIAYTRDTPARTIILSDDINGTNCFTIRNAGGGSVRLTIAKVIANTNTNLYTTLTDTVKIAIKWNGTSADVFVNGTKQVSATSYTTTVMQFLNGIGTDVPTFIQAMALYPTPLSDADCQIITS